MPESFGAGLRQRRERLQIPLATIAEQTKIKLSLLEALERDDVSRWPPGIFRRAFIRAYAHAIGLDPGVVVRRFLELYPDPIEDVRPVAAIAAAVDSVALSEPPPTRARYLLGAAGDLFSQLRFGSVQRRRSAADAAAADHGAPATAIVSSTLDLLAAAQLCTELGQVEEMCGAAPLLHRAVSILDAVGLVVWVWNPQAGELMAALAHGYSEKVLAQLPRVRRDDDNATASAFRSAQTSVVHGGRSASGALVVPLMTADGCAGVLAIEFKQDSAEREPVRALVTIFAAQLARVVGAGRPAQAVDRKLA